MMEPAPARAQAGSPQPATGDNYQPAFDPRRETQWWLMWRRFRQNRLSVFGLIVIGLFYLTMVCFPGFIAPYYHDRKFDDYVFAPPSKIRFVDEEGNFHWRPFIYGRKRSEERRVGKECGYGWVRGRPEGNACCDRS